MAVPDIAALVPPLAPELHKGQAGRVGIVGGSAEYTGAPYFAAMASLRLGADLAFVFCEPSAATAIKSYSPEVIVIPRTTDAADVQSYFSRLHVLVVGPGLGRDPAVQARVTETLREACKAQLPLIIDGDGLVLVEKNPGILRGNPHVILTPNVNEFGRLCKVLKVHEADGANPAVAARELAIALGNPTIVRKGAHDIITDGGPELVCKVEGSLRRCGGQGDLLAGSTATFLAWALRHPLIQIPAGGRPTMLAAYAACAVVREAGRLAHGRLGRATLASDMLQDIPRALAAFLPAASVL